MFTTSSLNSGSDPWKAWGIPLTYSMLATFCMSMRGIFCNLAIVTQHRLYRFSIISVKLAQCYFLQRQPPVTKT
eukprot:scaffold161853_cov16-Tisochrysis_lutea.AAC.3